MHTLHEQQAAFAHALQYGLSSDLGPAFVGPLAHTAARFAAYRRNVIGNWRMALHATYPVMARQLGPASFDALCDIVMTDAPSRNSDLNAYGAKLPTCLAALPATQRAPWLPDLARLEWALQEAYAAADPTPVSVTALQAIPPEHQGDVRIGLWPGACLLSSPWPVDAIWRPHQHADPQAEADALGMINLDTGYFAMLATRHPDGAPNVLSLSSGEAALWSACLAGRPLSDALAEAVAGSHGQDLTDTLASWLSARLIVSLNF